MTVGLAACACVGLGSAAVSAGEIVPVPQGKPAKIEFLSFGKTEFLSSGADAAVATAPQVAQNGSQIGSTSSSRVRGTQLSQNIIERGQTVRGRSRPDYDPQGYPVGAFVILPEMVVAPTFDDNIFRDERGERADLITVLSPTVAVESDWSRHSLNVEAGADIGLYYDNDDEDYEDFNFGADGRVDITRNTFVALDASFQNLHEDRGSPDDVRGSEPTEFDRITAEARGSHRFGRFTGSIGGEFLRTDFDDTPRAGGLADINNDDRDRNRYEGFAQLSYEIVPDYSAFVRGNGNVVEYDDTFDDAGLERSGYGYGVDAGIEIDFGGIIFGDFFAGYRVQERDDNALPTIEGVSVGGEITWNVTQLTTVTGIVEREIRETTIVGSAGSFDTTVAVEVDHELLRNLIVSLNVSGNQNDFDGIDRTDYEFVGGASVDYFLNRYLFFGAVYERIERISEGNAQGADYSVNVAGVRAGAQF